MLESTERNASNQENDNQKNVVDEDIKDNIKTNEENKEKKVKKEISEIPFFQTIKRKNSLENFNDESKALLSDKKESLEKKFGNLKEEYEKSNEKSIYDLIEYFRKKKINQNKTKDNEYDKEKIQSIMTEIEKKLKLLEIKTKAIYIFGFIYFIFYLIGIFQLLDLFDACKKQMGIIFNSFFFKRRRESDETFIELYINSCFKNLPEFDFTFFTSFLGSVPLNCCGFFISSIIFTILNSSLFFIFMKLDFDKEKYDFFDFFYILIFFLLFFILFGMVSLFAHEKFYDGIIKFEKVKENYENTINELKKKDKEKENQKENKKEIDEKKEKNDANQIEQLNYEKTEHSLNENDKNKKENSTQKLDNKVDKKENEPEKEGESNKNTKPYDYKKEKNYFYFLCAGIGIAYIINKVINYTIHSSFTYNTYENYFLLIFLLIYLISYAICLLFYLLFTVSLKYIYAKLEIDKDEDEDEEKNNNEKKQKFWKIFGFLLYYEKITLNHDKKTNDNNIENELNKKEENNENKPENRNLNTLLNLNLNRNSKDKIQGKALQINEIEDVSANNNENENKNEDKVNKVNKDNINNNDIKENVQNIRYCNLILLTICPCLKNCKKSNKNSKYCCASCKLGCRKFYYKSKGTEFGNLISLCCEWCKCDKKCCCYCCECCNCCECCEKVDLNENYAEEEIFCYAYNVQRKCSWLCDLFFKYNIISLIVNNIFVEIGIIGFEKRINENLESNGNIYYLKAIIIYFIFFLIFTMLYSKLLFVDLKLKNFSEYTGLALIFYSVDIIIAGIAAFIKKKSVKNFFNKWVIIIPLSFTKYINFIVTDQFITSLDKDDIDILSNSFIATCIFVIYDMIVFIISDIIDLSSDTLTIIEFILICFLFVFIWFYGICLSNECRQCCRC